MTVAEAVSRGYRLRRIGGAYLLTLNGAPLMASWRVGALLSLLECHSHVRDALRHGMRLA